MSNQTEETVALCWYPVGTGFGYRPCDRPATYSATPPNTPEGKRVMLCGIHARVKRYRDRAVRLKT